MFSNKINLIIKFSFLKNLSLVNNKNTHKYTKDDDRREQQQKRKKNSNKK
jgi:hypothetical protein